MLSLVGCHSMGKDTNRISYAFVYNEDEHWYYDHFTEEERDKFVGVMSRVSEKIKITDSLSKNIIHLNIDSFKNTGVYWCGGYNYVAFYNKENVLQQILAISAKVPGVVYLIEADEYQGEKLVTTATMKECKIKSPYLFNELRDIIKHNELIKLKTRASYDEEFGD
jgi:hypothetical protein